MTLPANDNSYGVVLSTKLQLVLDQPMADIETKLVNRDFEGDFFKKGDTVQIAKIDPDMVAISVGVSRTTPANFDAKLAATDMQFAAPMELTIDKAAKYAFLISQVQEAEGPWAYQSGGLELAGYNIRKGHNLETCQMLVDDAVASTGNTVAGHVYELGTPAAPIELASVDDIYTKVAVPMYTRLFGVGAITASAHVPFGNDSQEQHYDKAGIFLPPVAMGQLLQSKYLTDRSTTQADEKVATAAIGKLLGMDVSMEPALDPENSKTAVEITSAADGTFCIIAGTRNCITKANKVLPPVSQFSTTRFATEYHGLEIYAKKIIEPKAAVVAFCKIGTTKSGG